jgi:sodium transport system permease protein
MRVMRRDRRLVIGVAVTSLIVLPALMGVLGRIADPAPGQGQPVAVRLVDADSLVRAIVARTPGVVLSPSGAVSIVRDGTRYTIMADRTEPRAWTAASRLQEAFDSARARIVTEELTRLGVPSRAWQPFGIEMVDTSSREGRGALLMGTLVPYLVIVLLVANAIRSLYVAVGEKEKSTLASLLVCNVPRRAIVLGKTLAIMTFAIVASALLITGMTVFANAGFSLGGGGADMTIRLSPAQIVLLLLNITSLALLISAVIMILGTFARTQREAGVYTSPLLFISIFLAVFSFSSADFGLAAHAVPILGNSLAMRETILGNLTPAHLALPMTSSLLVFAVLTWGSVRLYERETVLFRP